MGEEKLSLRIDLEQIVLEPPRYRYSQVDGRILNSYVTIRHKGLGRSKEVSGIDKYIIESKLQEIIDKWIEEWDKVIERKEKLNFEEEQLSTALKKTKFAKEILNKMEDTLKYTLNIDDAINWELLIDKKPFPVKPPVEKSLNNFPSKPIKKQQYDIENYKFSFFERVIPFFKKQRIKMLIEHNNKIDLFFEDDHNRYKKKLESIEQENSNIITDNKKNYQSWLDKKSEFEASQNEHNAKISELAEKYKNFDTKAIETNCSMILNNSNHLDFVSKEFELEYGSDSQSIVIDYNLPDISSIPKIKEVQYIKSKQEFKESYYSDSEINKLYDSYIYQFTLRSIHEILEGDSIDAIKIISFNGWVRTINKSTGNEVTNCILSVTTKKSDFLKINLNNVDPKECFKSLKGVAASKLHTITAVNPIMYIKRTDRRFIESYNVIEKIDEGDNLAIMDWEDFEHLVRELFEKEFSHEGVEVKVTRASKDGGVDAVIFDPDPIKGGKIIIQAKRYTNVVGVAAVRDLYGAIVNEGANKGILVTTAQFGPDSYDFAKDKPITLLDGGNLLSLLNKHGRQARIDLKEAKIILKEL